MKPTNGHRSYAAWNITLWLSNDETLYSACMYAVKQAEIKRDKLKSDFMRRRFSIARYAAQVVLPLLPTKTPDGQRYTALNVSLAIEAMISDAGGGKL